MPWERGRDLEGDDKGDFVMKGLGFIIICELEDILCVIYDMR